VGASFKPAPIARDASPFDLDDNVAYARWRAWKLAHAPADVEALTVEVDDPRTLSAVERAALLDRIACANVALYRSQVIDEDKDLPRKLGSQLGLRQLDANWLADEDGISSIAVSRPLPPTALRAAPPEGERPAWGGPAPGGRDGRGGFIPYTDRPIRWHTDGYYHPAERCIRGMILHCVRPARSGGVNALLDHERAYIALRDASPDHVRALMQPDVMTIPARTDDDGVARPAQTGPVFSVDAGDGSLHMRYTARTRSIEWRGDAPTRAAVACLEALLAGSTPGIVRVQLQAGMGIVGHNVLHDRSGFEDDPAHPRLLYRARFLDRVDLPWEAPWRNG
jgi:Taurine catabolism dioxygenase TauD, TfdA family